MEEQDFEHSTYLVISVVDKEGLTILVYDLGVESEGLAIYIANEDCMYCLVSGVVMEEFMKGLLLKEERLDFLGVWYFLDDENAGKHHYDIFSTLLNARRSEANSQKIDDAYLHLVADAKRFHYWDIDGAMEVTDRGLSICNFIQMYDMPGDDGTL
jgi:hypothetical protein